MSDSKSDWEELGRILRGIAANPGDFLKELQAELLPWSSSQPAAKRTTKQGGPAACIVAVRERRAPDGTLCIERSFYSLSSMDAISFDPFIIKTEEAHEAAVARGLFGVLQANQQAWIEERVTEASLRKLKSHQAILHEQQKTVEAGHRLRRAVLSGEAELHARETASQRQAIQQASQQQAIPVHSLPVNSVPALPPRQAAPALTSSAPLRPNITDKQVEAAAVRALLEGVTTEQAWQPYKQALGKHWPPYAVQEVEDRLYEMWRINPVGPQCS